MHNFCSNTSAKRLLTFSMYAVISVGGTTACGKIENAQALVSEAKQYQQKGDSKAAIIQLKNALQQNPDDSEARYLLGTIYNETGDPKSAEKELQKAISLGMNSARVVPDLGRTLLMLGQFQQILDETDQLPTKNTAEIATLRGNAYLALGRAGEAKESFELAIRDKPDFPEALIGLAKHALLERDVEAAVRYSEQAVERNPKNVDVWIFKGDLLRAQGKNDSALAAYDEALKLKPDNVLAHTNKAFIEIAAQKFDAAQANIDAARKAAPGTLIIFHVQALLDFNRGKPAAALESLQQVLSIAPNHMPSVLLAGAVQDALGSAAQAEHHLNHYLENDPGNLYARKLLASIYLKNRQAQQAINALAPVLRGSPRDPQLLALAGESYMLAKDFTKATEYFEKASALAPQNAMIHTALGVSKLGQGQGDRAVAELERAINLDAKSPRAGILLVLTHLRQAEYDKALTAVKALEKEQPDNPFVQNLKGGVYLGKKELANARASFEKALSLQPTFYPAVANLAQLDLLDKKPDAAKKRFEALLEKDKKNVQAMTALANLALSQKQDKEATAWLERARNENPDEIQPAVLLGMHYLRLGEKQKSLTLAQKLQGTHPANPEVLDLLAQAQFANGDKAAALESYNKLVAAVPDSTLAQFRIASIHMAMQNPAAAADALKKALTMKPDFLDAQLALATLEVQKGNHEQALAIARQIQKQREKSPAGHQLEGEVLMAQQKPVQAAKAFDQAFALGKSGPLIMKLHASLNQAGKGKEANTRLIQWVKDHPADFYTRIYLAETYLAGQQNQAAIEQYQTILRQDSNYVPALNNLAWLHQQEKDYVRALEYAEKAHQLDANSPVVLDTLGWILVEQGNVARGLPFLQKAVSRAPEAGDIRYHLVLGLVKSGDKTTARKELTQLLASEKIFSKIDEAKALLKQMQ